MDERDYSPERACDNPVTPERLVSVTAGLDELSYEYVARIIGHDTVDAIRTSQQAGEAALTNLSDEDSEQFANDLDDYSELRSSLINHIKFKVGGHKGFWLDSYSHGVVYYARPAIAIDRNRTQLILSMSADDTELTPAKYLQITNMTDSTTSIESLELRPEDSHTLTDLFLMTEGVSKYLEKVLDNEPDAQQLRRIIHP